MVDVKFFNHQEFQIPGVKGPWFDHGTMTQGEMIHSLIHSYDGLVPQNVEEDDWCCDARSFSHRLNPEELAEAWNIILGEILEVGEQVLLFYEGTGDKPYGGVHSLIERLA